PDNECIQHLPREQQSKRYEQERARIVGPCKHNPRQQTEEHEEEPEHGHGQLVDRRAKRASQQDRLTDEEGTRHHQCLDKDSWLGPNAPILPCTIRSEDHDGKGGKKVVQGCKTLDATPPSHVQVCCVGCVNKVHFRALPCYPSQEMAFGVLDILHIPLLRAQNWHQKVPDTFESFGTSAD